MDGGSEFPRGLQRQEEIVCQSGEEHKRDQWLVPDMCGIGHRDLWIHSMKPMAKILVRH